MPFPYTFIPGTEAKSVEVNANFQYFEGAYQNSFHSNVNDPTAGQKAALPGTSGTPSDINRYVTDADSRNTDERAPTSHLMAKHTTGAPVDVGPSNVEGVSTATARADHRHLGVPQINAGQAIEVETDPDLGDATIHVLGGGPDRAVNNTTRTTTSITFVDLTGASLIVALGSPGYVSIGVSLSLKLTGLTDARGGGFQILRGSTVISGPWNLARALSAHEPYTVVMVDTGASVGSNTYKVQWRAKDASYGLECVKSVVAKIQ